MKENFSFEEAESIGKELGIDWMKFNVEEFSLGLNKELEHGTVNSDTNITNDNALATGKIVLAHLKKFPDYYTRLESMEREAEEYWKNKMSI